MAYILDVLESLKSRVLLATLAASDDYHRMVIIGWPHRNRQLEPAMKLDHTIISVFAPEGMDRDVSMYDNRPMKVEPCSISMFLGEAGDEELGTKFINFVQVEPNQEVAFGFHVKAAQVGGVLTPGDNMGVSILRARSENDICIFHHVGESETMDMALAALADAFNLAATTDDAFPWLEASVNGDELVIKFVDGVTGAPALEKVSARIGGQVRYVSELARKVRVFWIDIWASKVSLRDVFGRIIEAEFAGLIDTNTGLANRLDLADGTSAIITNVSSILIDDEQSEHILRMRFSLHAEYAITQDVQMTEIICTEIGHELNLGETPCVPRLNGGRWRGTLIGCRLPGNLLDALEALSVFAEDC